MPVSQNVNVNMPVETPLVNSVPTASSVQQPSPTRVTESAPTGVLRAGKPSDIGQTLAQIPVDTLPALNTEPTTTTSKPITSRPVTSRPAVQVRSAISRDNFNERLKAVPTVDQTETVHKPECSFEIPEFLLPYPTPINRFAQSQTCPTFFGADNTVEPELYKAFVEFWALNKRPDRFLRQRLQEEFEQKCMVPALTAHVLGGEACRSRQLLVYVQWLLHVRQLVFNI